MNIENIKISKVYDIKKKYKFLDEFFLKVLKTSRKNAKYIFKNISIPEYRTAIKFLSNKSNIN